MYMQHDDEYDEEKCNCHLCWILEYIIESICKCK